eukprot:TRINITY_DN3896_c0_g1_i1.p1 TRINITY_DN3896_c0_g1~~TRINITY_DN3896_c0_g1_i1.p1  ORF type:complete len:245 (+),score=7.69 TRINITY_DN3896_c0_g1_i1:50-784(+)
MLLRGHDGSPSLGASALVCVCVCVYVYIYIYFAHRSVLQQVASHRLRSDEVSSSGDCTQWIIAWQQDYETLCYLGRWNDVNDGAHFICETINLHYDIMNPDFVDKDAVKLFLVGDDSSAILYDHHSKSCLGHDGTSSKWIGPWSFRFLQIPVGSDATDCLFFETEAGNKDGLHMLSTKVQLQENYTKLYLDADGWHQERMQLLPEESKAEHFLTRFEDWSSEVALTSNTTEGATQHKLIDCGQR